MKRIILMISVILTVLFLASCSNSNIPVSSETKNTTTASSGSTSAAASGKSEKLNVIVPDGWNKVTGSVLEHQYMKNTASFMVKTENFYKNTLDEVVVEAESIFQKTFSGYTAVSKESIKVAGKDARKLVFTCNVGNLSMKYLYVYLFVGGATYAITFGDQASTFDSLSADYNTILNSMTVS